MGYFELLGSFGDVWGHFGPYLTSGMAACPQYLVPVPSAHTRARALPVRLLADYRTKVGGERGRLARGCWGAVATPPGSPVTARCHILIVGLQGGPTYWLAMHHRVGVTVGTHPTSIPPPLVCPVLRTQRLGDSSHPWGRIHITGIT